MSISAIARAACHPEKTYIITGGTGGFGLELAQWLVDRGAKKLILTSRSGITTGYQARKLRRWTHAGVHAKVLKLDASNVQQCRKLLQEAIRMGPAGAVFNLAMVRMTIFATLISKKDHETIFIFIGSSTSRLQDFYGIFRGKKFGIVEIFQHIHFQ